jgi:hypothetical protein
MAGHRRPSTTNPTGRPRQKELREQRRLTALQARFEAAGEDPTARLTAATEYLRGVVKHADAATARQVAEQIEKAAIQIGTRLFAGRRTPLEDR